MTILSTIAEGEYDTADVFLLIAVILFVLGAVAAVVERRRPVTVDHPRRTAWPLEQLLLFTGLASTALALLVL